MGSDYAVFTMVGPGASLSLRGSAGAALDQTILNSALSFLVTAWLENKKKHQGRKKKENSEEKLGLDNSAVRNEYCCGQGPEFNPRTHAW